MDKIKKLEETIKLLKDMLVVKDQQISERDKTIERLEKKLELSQATLGSIYKAYSDYNEKLGEI